MVKVSTFAAINEWLPLSPAAPSLKKLYGRELGASAAHEELNRPPHKRQCSDLVSVPVETMEPKHVDVGTAYVCYSVG